MSRQTLLSRAILWLHIVTGLFRPESRYISLSPHFKSISVLIKADYPSARIVTLPIHLWYQNLRHGNRHLDPGSPHRWRRQMRCLSQRTPHWTGTGAPGCFQWWSWSWTWWRSRSCSSCWWQNVGITHRIISVLIFEILWQSSPGYYRERQDTAMHKSGSPTLLCLQTSELGTLTSNALVVPKN